MSKLLFLLLSSLSLITQAQAADAPLPANLAQIENLQKRSDQLVFGEVGAENYHLAKARAWLDMALSEYHQTDTTGLMLSGISEADKLITALEKQQQNISMDTPNTMPGTELVRQDLWDKIAQIKKNSPLKCGQRQLAEAEVELVWAGHEKLEAGWSHAESYGRAAEDSLYVSETNRSNCAKAAGSPPASVAINAPVTPLAIVVTSPTVTTGIEKFTLSGDAMFVFGSDVLVSGASVSLDKLARSIKAWTSLESVSLVGYTDRLRSDGNEAKNQQLSEKRAKRIKQYLTSKGIPSDKISAEGAGSAKPVALCPDVTNKAQQIICLQPNRRVEITLRGDK
ncbi:MAG: hypothetical protein RL358_346 [Pseudomonadota bacterium]|jgi:outer membrane protein OmpA-like peptidoglycan-associated protein